MMQSVVAPLMRSSDFTEAIWTPMLSRVPQVGIVSAPRTFQSNIGLLFLSVPIGTLSMSLISNDH